MKMPDTCGHCGTWILGAAVHGPSPTTSDRMPHHRRCCKVLARMHGCDPRLPLEDVMAAVNARDGRNGGTAADESAAIAAELGAFPAIAIIGRRCAACRRWMRRGWRLGPRRAGMCGRRAYCPECMQAAGGVGRHARPLSAGRVRAAAKPAESSGDGV